jgi:glycosyltransferase involved in cell wall biosynthesis
VDSFGDNPIILTVGALIKQKNQAILIQAMGKVLEQFPDAKLVIVGDGPLREELESTANEIGIASNVIFTGYVPTREEVYQIMKAATVFAMSSDYEGFCVAAVEAMACGVPVVASDLTVFHEVIGKNGVFAERGDIKEFAAALNGLLADTNRRAELANQMRQRAEKKYSLKKTAKNHRDIYINLLK